MRFICRGIVTGLVLVAALISMAGGGVHAAATLSAHKTIQAVTVDANSGQYAFRPHTAKIKVGTKVTWTNASDVDHNVTSDTKSWKFVKTLATGGSLSYTFKKAGTYKYSCTIHPGMTGKIIVSK